MTLRFQPTEHVRAELRRRCQVGGVVVTDVVWDPKRQCLVIMDMRKDGTWVFDRALRDDDGEPRQVHMGDVVHDERRIYGHRCSMSDGERYVDEMEARNAARKAQFRNAQQQVYRDLAKKGIEAFHGTGPRSVPVSNSGARDWSQYQYVCSHGVVKARCSECGPARPIVYDLQRMNRQAATEQGRGFKVIDRRRAV